MGEIHEKAKQQIEHVMHYMNEPAEHLIHMHGTVIAPKPNIPKKL